MSDSLAIRRLNKNREKRQNNSKKYIFYPTIIKGANTCKSCGNFFLTLSIHKKKEEFIRRVDGDISNFEGSYCYRYKRLDH